MQVLQAPRCSMQGSRAMVTSLEDAYSLYKYMKYCFVSTLAMLTTPEAAHGINK